MKTSMCTTKAGAASNSNLFVALNIERRLLSSPITFKFNSLFPIVACLLEHSKATKYINDMITHIEKVVFKCVEKKIKCEVSLDRADG